MFKMWREERGWFITWAIWVAVTFTVIAVVVLNAGPDPNVAQRTEEYAETHSTLTCDRVEREDGFDIHCREKS